MNTLQLSVATKSAVCFFFLKKKQTKKDFNNLV